MPLGTLRNKHGALALNSRMSVTGRGAHMEKQPDYWAGWMDGWAAATNAIFAARNTAPVPQPARLEPSLAEAAGNKPTPRRRGRPPKSAALALAAPRKRGRPPKHRPA